MLASCGGDPICPYLTIRGVREESGAVGRPPVSGGEPDRVLAAVVLACLVSPQRQRTLAHAGILLPQPRVLVVHADAVRLVDLADLLRADGPGEAHPVITRDGERGRLAAAGRDVDQDQGVRGVAADPPQDRAPAPRVQLRQDPVRQHVAVPVPPALQPHQQDVLGADRRTAGDRVRGSDIADVPDDVPGVAADEQDEGRKHAGHGVPGNAGDPPRRALRHPCPLPAFSGIVSRAGGTRPLVTLAACANGTTTRITNRRTMTCPNRTAGTHGTGTGRTGPATHATGTSRRPVATAMRPGG